MPGARAFDAAAVAAALRAAVGDLPEGATKALLTSDLGRYAALLAQALGRCSVFVVSDVEHARLLEFGLDA